MTLHEISGEYEKETGRLIAETFEVLDYQAICGVLVHSHGPFTWGRDAIDSVKMSIVLENVAHMAFNTELLFVAVGKGGGIPMQHDLLAKHYSHRHGPGANSGQPEG